MADLGDLLEDLSLAFPRDKRTLESLLLYRRMLSDLPLEAVSEAIYELLSTQTFHAIPTIAEIRLLAIERQLQLPLENEALTQVEARIAWARDRSGERSYVHPLVLEALDHVGGFPAYRGAENPSVIRGQFLKLYREMREQAIRDRQVVRQLPDAPARRLELPAGDADAA